MFGYSGRQVFRRSQRRHLNTRIPEHQILRVRIALHTGAVTVRDGDYSGLPLSRVARLLAVTHGGQVLLSRATQELVRDHLPDGVSLCDLGEHRLKDLTRPEHIFQLTSPDLPADFPLLDTLDLRPQNLPAQVTPLIGRESEVTAVQKLLRREAGAGEARARLVTLTGPGGTGKTRVGLQIAAELLDQFADGVFFVDLAPLSDPTLVASTIAHALSVREMAGRSLLESLKEHLRAKQLLLLLDNFEQVLPAASLVSELLASCPRLQVLATSRAILHLRGEYEFPVPPLALPDPKRLPPLEALTQYAAVELFIQRAVAVRPDFTVDNGNAPAVAEICHRLDGLPLAIELAAARIRLFTPQELLSRLQSRLAVLTGGPRDLPARQQTIRKAIAWSYDLLEAEEQKLFRRLAVFVGGSTLEAAQAVCPRDGELDIDISDGLTCLMEQSLLRQEQHPAHGARFTMLETIREFGRECLSQSSETATVRQQHACCFLKLVEQAQPEIRGRLEGVWFDRLEKELDNLRAALDWLVESEQAEEGLRMADVMGEFWAVRGYLSEGRERVMKLLAAAPDHAVTPARANVLIRAGVFLSWQGDYASAEGLYSESVALQRQLGNQPGIGASLVYLANVVMSQGDYRRAHALFEEGLAVHRQSGYQYGIVKALTGRGELARCEGDDKRAAELLEEGIPIARELGSDVLLTSQLHNLGHVTLGQGDPIRSASLFRESLTLSLKLGHQIGILSAFSGLAGVAAALRQPEQAAQLFGAADGLCEAYAFTRWPADRICYERNLSKARAQLSDEAFAASWAEGRAMPLEQATRLAQEVAASSSAAEGA